MCLPSGRRRGTTDVKRRCVPAHPALVQAAAVSRLQRHVRVDVAPLEARAPGAERKLLAPEHAHAPVDRGRASAPPSRGTGPVGPRGRDPIPRSPVAVPDPRGSARRRARSPPPVQGGHRRNRGRLQVDRRGGRTDRPRGGGADAQAGGVREGGGAGGRASRGAGGRRVRAMGWARQRLGQGPGPIAALPRRGPGDGA